MVMVHGFGADRNSWLGTAADLFNHTTVYTVEIPGHGNALDVPVASSLPELCEQSLAPAIEKIATESGQPAHLLGHSLGGALCMLAAGQDNETVASISLIAPHGLGGGVNRAFVEKFVSLDDATSTLETLQTTVFNTKLISRPLIEPLLHRLQQPGVRESLQTLAQLVVQSDAALNEAMDQMAQSALPRLVIWGRDDTINPFVAEDQQRWGGTWHTLADCGHLPHVEHRTKVNRWLIELVQSTTAI